MTTLLFIILIILCLLWLSFALGAHCHYHRGYWDGYDDSERSRHTDADTISAIKWARYHRDDEALNPKH